MASHPMKSPTTGGLAVLCLGLLLTAGPAAAQSMNTNSAAFNAGYGRAAGQENHVVDYSTRDANGNRLIVDGVMLTGADQSVYSSSQASGSLDSYSGVGGWGSSGASAIGNNLTVITQGNNNTVIVNSTQTNTGNISAGAQTNSGGVSNGN